MEVNCMKKKLIAWALCLLMLLSILPCFVLAEDEKTEGDRLSLIHI